ncbi:hypothetical protein TRVA0_039S00672 [Trichomonascus vanleenenianus]|uniref:uncharacterized protein n=1 Tax=Trichomonascus vanleenenianus TaxID=2268995 RepID=UPI003ECA861C
MSSSSSKWSQELRFQPNKATQASFRQSLESFGEQEAKTKSIQRTLESLYLTSNKLRITTEGVKSSMKPIPQAEGALDKIVPKK